MKRRRPHFYVLDKSGEPVGVWDVQDWAKMFETAYAGGTCIVKQEWVENVRVSTIFLGVDYSLNPDVPPILWETLCFSNRANFDGEQRRCSGNREQAEAMHAKMVQYVQEEITKTK